MLLSPNDAKRVRPPVACLLRLDVDPLGFGLHALRQRDHQQPVYVLGSGLLVIDLTRQRDRSTKGTIAALGILIAAPLFAVVPFYALQGQPIFRHTDREVISVQTGQLGGYDNVDIGFVHVRCRPSLLRRRLSLAYPSRLPAADGTPAQAPGRCPHVSVLMPVASFVATTEPYVHLPIWHHLLLSCSFFDLDLDLTRFGLLRFRQLQGQYAVVQPGGNFSLIDLVAELELPEKIDQIELAVDRLALNCVFRLGLNRQNIVLQPHIEVTWPDARQIGEQYQAIRALIDINRWLYVALLGARRLAARCRLLLTRGCDGFLRHKSIPPSFFVWQLSYLYADLLGLCFLRFRQAQY